MPVKYDEYYSAQDHALGPAFKDVIAFFQNLEVGQTVLDVGVGQGRDAIPLAQMGHRVIGIDLSSIGIEQLKNAAASQHLNIDAQVADLIQEVRQQTDVVEESEPEQAVDPASE